MIIEALAVASAVPVAYRLLCGGQPPKREEKEMWLLGGSKKEQPAPIAPSEFSMDSCFSMFGQNSPRLKAEEISKIQGIDPKKGVYQEYRYRREY
jgi:hypothetical protein